MAVDKSTADQITGWYQQYLGRAPEAGALDYWSSNAAQGGDVAAGIMASPEYQQRQSSGLVGAATAPTPSYTPNFEFKEYNGQQVRTDADYMYNLEQAAKAEGISAMEYDKRGNPDTYGARWGIPASGTKSASATSTTGIPSGVTTLNPDNLAKRTINAGTETVAGQMNTLLDANSPFLQRARALGQRQASERGLVNSSMAGTAGEAAAIDASLQIATPDASAYKSAGDYNTALTNQASMYNADALNSAATQQRGLNSQMALAQMQDATSRYQIEKQDATSRYNTDAQYRRQADANADSLANNILMTTDLSPDRKAALLESLGKGTAPKRGADGKVIPGSGLAGSIYVIDSVAADLAQ
jgi:hypothetical protein